MLLALDSCHDRQAVMTRWRYSILASVHAVVWRVGVAAGIDVKNVFYVFYFGHVFYVF